MLPWSSKKAFISGRKFRLNASSLNSSETSSDELWLISSAEVLGWFKRFSNVSFRHWSESLRQSYSGRWLISHFYSALIERFIQRNFLIHPNFCMIEIEAYIFRQTPKKERNWGFRVNLFCLKNQSLYSPFCCQKRFI